MNPYPIYKDSGVPWLGEVPEDWQAIPLCAISKLKSITDCEHLELLSVYLDKGVVRFLDVDQKRTNATSEDRSKYQKVEPGDFVLNNQQAWRGSVGVSRQTGIVSPAYLVLDVSKQLDSHYANYLFRDKSMVGHYLVSSKGVGSIQRNLYWPQLKRVTIYIPPLSEQHHIARYLDWQTSRINTFIKAKKKLIALLKEQKQVIINEAVTKGITPDVTMKDSGVPWIGMIPEKWDSVRLKNCISSIDQGWSPQCEAQTAGANDWGVLKVGCVNDDYFNANQNKKLPEELSPKLQCKIHENDIIVSRANTKELVGLAAIVDRSYPNILLCDKLYRFKAKSEISVAHFLVYSIRCSASREQIEEKATGASSSMQNISQSVIRNLLIPLPPTIDEQLLILDYISQETTLIDQTIARTEREIDLIREYRTRLVSDVVTGKIDVRSVSIPDFDPVEETADEPDGTLLDDPMDEEEAP